MEALAKTLSKPATANKKTKDVEAISLEKSSDDDEEEKKLDKVDIKAKHEQPTEGMKTEMYDNLSRILFKRCTKTAEKNNRTSLWLVWRTKIMNKTLYEEKG